jgi:hypothetical protein
LGRWTGYMPGPPALAVKKRGFLADICHEDQETAGRGWGCVAVMR